MNWWTQLRAWAARAIQPPLSLSDSEQIPNAGDVVKSTTSPSSGGVAVNSPSMNYPGWYQPRELSPAEKSRREQQEQVLRLMLTTSSPAGWISNHLEEANQCAGWVYVGTDARAKRVAEAELTVRRVDQADPDNPRKVRADHPLSRLLCRPNPKYDLWGLLYRIEMQLCLTGTALIWCPRNQLGLPCELWCLPTALARPQPPSPEYPEGAYQVSTVSLSHFSFFGASFWNTPSGAPMIIDAREVVRIQYPHPYTEADGLSPVWANGQAVDVARSTEEALWNVMERGPLPSLLISIDKGIALDSDTADEIKSRVKTQAGGSRNAGEPVVTQGATVEKLTLSPSEIIPEDLRNQNRDNVLAMFGVPAVVAGVTEATAYSAHYAGMQQFDDQQIGPECRMIAGALTLHLACHYGHDLEIKLKPSPLNDPDLKLRDRQQAVAEAEAIASTGVGTVNEVRAKLGLPPHEDEQIGNSPAGGQQQQPGMPGLADQLPGMGGGPTDGAMGGAGPDGPGVGNPALRAGPVGDLNQLKTRAKSLDLPKAPWNGRRKAVRS